MYKGTEHKKLQAYLMAALQLDLDSCEANAVLRVVAVPQGHQSCIPGEIGIYLVKKREYVKGFLCFRGDWHFKGDLKQYLDDSLID